MIEKNFTIEGMSCASCAQTVEKATKKLSGVQESTVNLATEKMHITYDEAKLTDKDIQEAVNQSGYKAVTNTKQKNYVIEGMTCASCAQTIEKAVGKLAAVQMVNVNLATEKMSIEYDPDQLVLADVTKAVEEVGYTAHEEVETGDEIDRTREKKHST